MRLLLGGQQLIWTFEQRLQPPLDAGRASLRTQDRRPVHNSCRQKFESTMGGFSWRLRAAESAEWS
jgi:hypothetical protein